MDYPEAAWLGKCTNAFPSRVQWLYKELIDIPISKVNYIPDDSTTYTIVHNTNATLGSGKTMQKFPIEQQVSLDWVIYAIRRNCWNLLYTSQKVNATNSGVDQFEQRIKEVLDIAVREGVFVSYNITSKVLDSKNNKVSFKFTAYLQYSILGVDKVEGVVYQ